MTDGQQFKVGDKVSISHTVYKGYFQKDLALYGTLISKKPYPTYPTEDMHLIMYDVGSHIGVPYEDMNPKCMAEIRKLNIPDYQNRKYSCVARKNLSFYSLKTDSSLVTKEKTMSNKLVETLKGDAKEAAYRVAGTQITNGVKMGLVKLFESKGGNSDQMVMLKGLLDSEIGDSLISLILGYGLNYAPRLKDDPRIQKLSEEFRINGMSVAGNAIVGAAMESLLPVLSTALAALPEEASSNTRISESSEEEEEEDAPPAKVAKTATR